MDPEMFEAAKERAQALGFSTFSSYVVQLLRADLTQRGRMVLEENSATTDFAAAVPPSKPANYREKLPRAKKPKSGR